MPITWSRPASDGTLKGAGTRANYTITVRGDRYHVDHPHAPFHGFGAMSTAQMWCNRYDYDHVAQYVAEPAAKPAGDAFSVMAEVQFALDRRIAADAIALSQRQEAAEEQRFWDAAFQSALARTPGESNPADVVLAEDCANLAVQRRRARIEAERKKIEEERTKEP